MPSSISRASRSAMAFEQRVRKQPRLWLTHIDMTTDIMRLIARLQRRADDASSTNSTMGIV